jgi:hypothetical protein
LWMAPLGQIEVVALTNYTARGGVAVSHGRLPEAGSPASERRGACSFAVVSAENRLPIGRFPPTRETCWYG